MRARMAISVSRTTVELREVILRDMPASLMACSPKGTVPVLVLPDGQVLEESRDIIDWALVLHTNPLIDTFLIISVVSFALIMAIYELLIRRFNIIRFFFGMRPRRQ